MQAYGVRLPPYRLAGDERDVAAAAKAVGGPCALKLVSVAGALRPCPDRPDSPVCGSESDSAASYVVNGMTRSLDRRKYVAAHRLEAAVRPWLDVGFQTHNRTFTGERGLTMGTSIAIR